MEPTRLAAIDAYENGCLELRTAVAGMSPEQLKARPVAGRWSVLEVICHLADSEQAWCHRMKRTIAEDRPLLIGYDESRFIGALHYHDRDAASELNLFEANRRQMAAVLRGCGPEDWSRPAVHNERGLVTLAEMLEIETEHVAHHLRFVAEKRRGLGLSAP